MSEEQEALSHQHYGWWVVPLASGLVAVFTHPNGKLLSICRWIEVKNVSLPPVPVYRAAQAPLTLDELLS